ncbi:hypothetical protein MJG53_009225 [Ovis ammon polii x Ovis aries]|uniref:Uncharacterized protein n=1 Tax=Ovis ammon polii x Ovis aries TaxID=2918886 RepID=A0ACB9UWY5_9CETA|nr:hypothetical protein MJG53_009225 [Ovis ammon polii x Ovis aries]
MFRPESLLCLALRSAQRLRGVRGADHILEVVYVELWMLHALFGQDSEMLAAFYAWFRVSLVVSTVPGCGVLVFIIGPPLYQYVTKFLIVAMSFQLRIRRNRGPGSLSYGACAPGPGSLNTEPTRCNYEALSPTARAPQREKPLQPEARTALAMARARRNQIEPTHEDPAQCKI